MAKRLKSKKSPPKAEPISEVKTEELAQGPKTFPWIALLQALAIVAAGLWIYSPVFHGGWLMDDNAYVTQNPSLRSVDGLINFWLMPGSFVEFYPIEETLLWFQWQLWQNDASGYHVTNIILHIIGSLLVWKFFSKLGLRFAWLAGLIFCIHPVQVESVAWVAELKNTLSLPPFLIAMCFWIDYEENKRDRDYFLALGFFLAAMLCKITMAPFPIIILLYAWWKRGRIGWADVKGALPFFVISLILGMMTVYVGQPMGDFWSRLACAGITISFYFFHFFLPLQFSQPYPQWPVDFLPLQMLPAYPQWKFDQPTLQQFLPWPIMAGLFCWFWARRRTWGKTVLLGLGFFLLGLLPFIGFHEVSYMRFTWVMDHFLYLPSLGLLGIAIAGIEQIDNQLSKSFGSWLANTRAAGNAMDDWLLRLLARVPLVIVAAVVVVTLTVMSRNYAKTFVNLETSWTYEIKYNPDAWLAHNNLGYIMVEQNRLDEAKVQFIEALRIKPDYSEAHNNLGVVYSRMGDVANAITQYQAALQVNPDYGDAQNNLDKLEALQRNMNAAMQNAAMQKINAAIQHTAIQNSTAAPKK